MFSRRLLARDVDFVVAVDRWRPLCALTVFPLPVSSDAAVPAGQLPSLLWPIISGAKAWLQRCILDHSRVQQSPIVTLCGDVRDSSACADGHAECRRTENIVPHHESENPVKD